MNLKAIIFDLDQTLISSEAAESLRSQRKWDQVYEMIPQLTPFEGIASLLKCLAMLEIKSAIVTSSAGPYCRKVISHWGWNIDTTVTFYDTDKRKPEPDPILKALSNLDLSPQEVISIGDLPKDIISSKRAGVFSVASLWGVSDPKPLLQEKPDLVCRTVQEFQDYVQKLKKKA
jgi:phosphoglycolate phosphatase-like HAD superfamily hydrolase